MLAALEPEVAAPRGLADLRVLHECFEAWRECRGDKQFEKMERELATDSQEARTCVPRTSPSRTPERWSEESCPSPQQVDQVWRDVVAWVAPVVPLSPKRLMKHNKRHSEWSVSHRSIKASEKWDSGKLQEESLPQVHREKAPAWRCHVDVAPDDCPEHTLSSH